MNSIRFVHFNILFLFTFNCAFAQDPLQLDQLDSSLVYKFTLHDNTELIGTLLEKNASTIAIRTNYIPRVDLPIMNIKKISAIDMSNMRNGELWFTNPNATRYFFGPSAFNIPNGKGYYQNSYIIFNALNIGMTNNFSMGGGFEFFTTILGDPVFFLTPKIGTKVADEVHIGGGLLYISAPSVGGNRRGLGIGYGMITKGTLNDNITAALGWGFVNGEFSAMPNITISGMTRTTKNIAWVTENWFIPSSDGYNPLFSYGIRFFGESIAVDIAFINNPDIAKGLTIGIPYLDFVWAF